MKVTMIKYINSKGKVTEMVKNNFIGKYLPENIIEEYEVEIKREYSNELEDLIRKFESGNYILLGKARFKIGNPRSVFGGWVICDLKDDGGVEYWDSKVEGGVEYYDHKLIHKKHKDILEAYLKNPSVEIETGMFAPMTGETEPSKWVKLEKDFIEDYNEEFWYRLKVKDLAWYEKEDNFRIAVKQIKSLNDFKDKDGKIYIMEKFTDDKGVSSYFTDGYHTPLQWLDYYRPATESEVLSLVYKPLQKVSKENTLAESDRLKDLFLDDKAECLVENEQEFKLVYDFLDKNCDESLNRYLEMDGSFNYNRFYSVLPIIISTLRKWGNVFEWNKLKNRDINKPLIKFDGEVFWEVFE